MKNDFIFILSAGHGGYDKETDTNYTPVKNGKFFTHTHGEFHAQTTFYEGYKNRWFMDEVYKLLIAEGCRAYKVYAPLVDTSLHKRVELANNIMETFPESKCVYISEHSNASASHKARGFCAFTSPGVTKSDEYATALIELYKHKFGMHIDDRAEFIRIREDSSDGDPDHEARFYELVKTKMPAVLIENLFFDQFLDAQLLISEKYRSEYTRTLLKWMMEMQS